MRWRNYYLAADARISLREENVVLWENTLNSSPPGPSLGIHRFKREGLRVLICVPWGAGRGGRFLLCTASPRVLSEEVAQSRDMNEMKEFWGKSIAGGWNTG